MNEVLRDATAKLYAGELRAAAEAAEGALQDPQLQPQSAEAWEFRFIKTESLRIQGNRKEALRELESYASGELAPEIRARLRMHQGYCLAMLGRYAEAREALDEAHDFASTHGMQTLLAEVKVRQAMFFYLMKDYDDSEPLYRSALAVAQAQRERYLEGVALFGLGKNRMIREEYEAAIGWFNRALVIAQEIGMRTFIGTIWSDIGTCHYKLDELDEALEVMRKAEAALLETEAMGNYQITLADIGNIYCKRRDFPTAISYFQRALKLARELNDPVSTAKWASNLAAVWAATGNPAGAAQLRAEVLQIRGQLAAERDRARGHAERAT